MKLRSSFVSQNYSILLACLVDDLAAEFYNYLNFLFFFFLIFGVSVSDFLGLSRFCCWFS